MTCAFNLPITIDEAMNGAKVKVPTVDGPVMLAVPAWQHFGQDAAPQGAGLLAQERRTRRSARHADDRSARR
jgi:DnaJ-class molecular chaperone